MNALQKTTQQLLRSGRQKLPCTLCVALQGVGTWQAGLGMLAYLTYQVHSAELAAGGLSPFWQLWSHGSMLAAGLPHYVMLLAVLHGWLNARETDQPYASAFSRAFLAAFALFGVLLLCLLGAFWGTDGQILRNKGEWSYSLYLESMRAFLPLLALGTIMAAAGLRKRTALMSSVSVAAAAAAITVVTALAARHASGLPDWLTTGTPSFYPRPLLTALFVAAVLGATAFLIVLMVKSGRGAAVAVSAGAAMLWALAAGAATGHVAPFRDLTSLVWFEKGDPTWWVLVGCMNGGAILLAAARICAHLCRRRKNAGQGGDAAASATAEKG